MERYLMTQSLLSSWAYMFNSPEGFEEEAKSDFLGTLNREPHEPTPAMQNGINFENLCYGIATGTYQPTDGKLPYNFAGASKVAQILRGAQIQVKAMRDINVFGMDLLLYGILDGLKAGVIYDVKYLNKSMNSAELAGKYLESAQHPAYFRLIPDAYEFQYLVSDGTDLYIEKYSRKDTPPIESIIEPFFQWLDGERLMDVYKEKWLAK